jgi:septal ring factor EnvC (AmiA/AmiB activator)
MTTTTTTTLATLQDELRRARAYYIGYTTHTLRRLQRELAAYSAQADASGSALADSPDSADARDRHYTAMQAIAYKTGQIAGYCLSIDHALRRDTGYTLNAHTNACGLQLHRLGTDAADDQRLHDEYIKHVFQ